MVAERARSTTTLLAIAIVVLLGQATWQEVRARSLKAQLEQSRRQFAEAVGKAATEQLRGHRADLVEAERWLHQYYKSADGLQRPNGLWRDDRKEPDFEAIGTWVFDVYLNARVAGASDEAARQSVTEAIRTSDEWRRRHAPK